MTNILENLFRINCKNKNINLSSGNPAWNGPEFLFKSSADMMNKMASEHDSIGGDISRYNSSSGEEQFKKEMRDFFIETLNCSSKNRSQKNVVFANGVTHLWSCFLELIKDKESDKFRGKTPVILFPSMTYGIHTESATRAGFEVCGIPISSETGFHLQASDLEHAICEIEKDKTKKVVCIKIDDPHNPSGAVLNKNDIEKITAVCRKHKIRIFNDLAYCGLEYDDNKVFPFATLGDARAITFTAVSLSKTAGAPGLRAGAGFGETNDVNFISKKISNDMCTSSIIAQQCCADYFSPRNADLREKYLTKIRAWYSTRSKMFQASILGKDSINWTPFELDYLETVIETLEYYYADDVKNALKHGTDHIKFRFKISLEW